MKVVPRESLVLYRSERFFNKGASMFHDVESNPDFSEMEKKILDYWDSKGLLKKYLVKNNNSKKKFKFLDGPITANNPMGVHHAHGRTLKDFFQRYYTMKGFKQRYQNGFD
jgi:isoleucyl-tRNA synthetase